MYIGVDVGGTKVLVATLDEHGVIQESSKFATPSHYPDFLAKLSETVAGFATKDFRAGGIAIPATHIDREHGRALSFGNLPWGEVDIHNDIERILHCPVVVENDAKLGALSEAMLLKDKFQRVLYVTVSTGIGFGLVVGQQIDPNFGDGGGRTFLVEHRGKWQAWEDVASGHAIVKRYGKFAHDITDDTTWKAISRDLAVGLMELIALTEPEVVVFGGSVGVYFERFGDFLAQELKKFETPLVPAPVLQKAQRPEEAVVYGCYDLAEATFGKKAPHA